MRWSVVTLIVLLSQQALAQPADTPPEPVPPVEDPSLAPPEPPPAPQPPPETPPPAPPRVVFPPPPPLAVVQTPTPTPRERPVCGQGHPRPHCRTIFLLEGSYRGGTTTTAAFEIGLLVNLGTQHAIGATYGGLGYEHRLALMTSNDASSVYKVRYRRWLTKDVGLDLGVGAGRFGGLGEIAIEYKDIIALTGGVNTFPVEFGRGAGANVGVRLGATGLLYLLYGLAVLGGGR